MGSAYPRSIELLRWSCNGREHGRGDGSDGAESFEEHNPQLYLALALLSKKSALVMVKNTDVNNGDESVAGTERCVRQQQQGSPTSTNAVLVTTKTTRVDCSDDRK